MASLSRRLVRALPDPLWALIQHVPVVTTRGRILHRIDKAETAAWLRGRRAALADTAIADLAERIERGPQPVRITSTGCTLRLVS